MTDWLKWVGIAMIVVGLLCIFAAYHVEGAPELILTQEDCERCHGNNTTPLHLEQYPGYDCFDCHFDDNGNWVDLSTCFPVTIVLVTIHTSHNYRPFPFLYWCCLSS